MSLSDSKDPCLRSSSVLDKVNGDFIFSWIVRDRWTISIYASFVAYLSQSPPCDVVRRLFCGFRLLILRWQAILQLRRPEISIYTTLNSHELRMVPLLGYHSSTEHDDVV